MWSNGIKIDFFPKPYKNRPATGDFAPTPPSVKRLSTLAYSHTSPKLDIFTF